jgi:hypothetical protein
VSPTRASGQYGIGTRAKGRHAGTHCAELKFGHPPEPAGASEAVFRRVERPLEGRKGRNGVWVRARVPPALRAPPWWAPHQEGEDDGGNSKRKAHAQPWIRSGGRVERYA